MSNRPKPLRGPARGVGIPAESAPGAAINYGQLNHRLGYAIRRAQIAIFQDFFSAFAVLKIRPAQYSILTVIENNPGLSQTQVAGALGIKKTNFVAMIDALEKRALIARRPVPQDRRSYALFLAPSGMTLMPKLHALADEHEQRIIALTGAQTYALLAEPIRAIARLAPEPGE